MEYEKYYVVYSYRAMIFFRIKGSSLVFTDSQVLNYDVIQEFRRYLSKEWCNGRQVIIENIIKMGTPKNNNNN